MQERIDSLSYISLPEISYKTYDSLASRNLYTKEDREFPSIREKRNRTKKSEQNLIFNLLEEETLCHKLPEETVKRIP